MLTQSELADVIRGCRRNDRLAQNRLYRAFYGWASSICRRYAQTEFAAEECVQDAFYKVFTKINTFQNHLSFEGWFKTIIIRTCIDRYRSAIHELPIQAISEFESDEPVIAEALIHANAEHLLHFVRQLPPAYQSVFNLYAVEGYEYQEIAELLQVSVGAVKSNLHKARMKLRLMLSENQSINFYAR